MRTPFVAANWKMYKTVAEARAYVREFAALVADVQDVEIVVAPPFLGVTAAAEAARGTRVGVAGQDLYWEREGAFTGEVSAGMLKEAGARYVIIGHSERRTKFGETDEHVNKKVHAAVAGGLTPIVCVGETLDERERDQTLAVLDRQLKRGLEGLSSEAVAGFAVAYEPVWAIGTGRNATAAQAQEAHAHIRGRLCELVRRGGRGCVPDPLRRQREAGEYEGTGEPGRRGRRAGRRCEPGSAGVCGNRGGEPAGQDIIQGSGLEDQGSWMYPAWGRDRMERGSSHPRDATRALRPAGSKRAAVVFQYLMTFVYVLVCLILLMAILLQQGRGGDIASAFGGSGSQTAFGARAGATLLTRITTVAAVLFMIGSIGLGILWQRGGSSSVVEREVGADQRACEAGACGACEEIGSGLRAGLRAQGVAGVTPTVVDRLSGLIRFGFSRT